MARLCSSHGRIEPSGTSAAHTSFTVGGTQVHHSCEFIVEVGLTGLLRIRGAMSAALPLQVLSPLAPYDLLWVAALPGISEEVLFRGALIPALSPDW